MRSDHLRSFGDIETWHARADDERGNLGPSVWSCSRAGKHCIEISDAGVRNKTLSTIDNVGIAFALGRGFQSGDVRAGVRFRQSEGGDRLSGGRSLEPKITHVLSRCQADRVSSESLHHEGQIGKR